MKVAGSLLLATICLFACQHEPASLAPAWSERHEVSTASSLRLTYELEADISLLLKVMPFEAEFEVLSHNPKSLSGEQRSRIPYLRIGPVYRVIPDSSDAQELMVEIKTVHATDRASVTIEAFVLSENNANDIQRAKAFQLYSQAIESADSEDSDLWAIRIAGLKEAAEIFDGLGMTEEKLWSEYLGAYFTYFPIYNLSKAIAITRRVQDEAAAVDLDQIVLAAMQLRANAMIERDDADSPAEAEVKFAQAELLFDEVVEFAQSLDMRFEAAWAINGKGIGYFYQDRVEEALEQYEKALPMARELEDRYFVSLVGGNIALA